MYSLNFQADPVSYVCSGCFSLYSSASSCSFNPLYKKGSHWCDLNALFLNLCLSYCLKIVMVFVQCSNFVSLPLIASFVMILIFEIELEKKMELLGVARGIQGLKAWIQGQTTIFLIGIVQVCLMMVAFMLRRYLRLNLVVENQKQS